MSASSFCALGSFGAGNPAASSSSRRLRASPGASCNPSNRCASFAYSVLEVLNTASTEYAKEAHRFDGLQLAPGLARKRLLLELAAGFPAPNDPKAQKELADILASVDGDDGKGKWCQ